MFDLHSKFLLEVCPPSVDCSYLEEEECLVFKGLMLEDKEIWLT